MSDEHDHRIRRCPLLGHDIAFGYCRRPGRDIPCGKIYDCWWETLDITAFMEANYEPEVISEVLRPKPAKVMSLIDIIERARRQQKREEAKDAN